MSDNNNNRQDYTRPDASNFKINIDDNDFSMPKETMDSVNGRHRVSVSVSDINERDESNFYRGDEKEKTAKREHKKRDKIKAHKNKRVFTFVWLAMVILVGLTLASCLITGTNDLFAIDRAEGMATVTIPKDVTAKELGEILEEGGVVNNGKFFQLYCMLTTKMEFFTPGVYEIETNKDYELLVNDLQMGDANREVVQITFPEGLSLQQVAEKLEENGVASADDIVAAASSDNFDAYDMIEALEDNPDRYSKLEGYLFPDTYDFYVNEEIDTVLGKFLNNFQSKITQSMFEEIQKSDYSLDEIIILASIIEKEAADVEDMYMISAILHNRLENGDSMDIPNLGCDSTMFYPYSSKKEAPEGYSSNYNTYEIEGLPAGAICNPGSDAINAAINPNPEGSNYYYFCHDKEGKAYYASNIDEHNQNLQAAGLTD